MTPEFTDETAVIMGSTRGIGREIARAFADRGASVIINGRDSESGVAVAETITDAGGTARFVQADMTSYNEVQELMNTAVDAFDGIDILVTNGAAGIGPTPRFFEDMRPEDILEWCRVGYATRLYAVHAGLEYLKESEGNVINITADAGRVPTPAEVGPGGAAAAVLMATRVLAKELARYNIRVNAVSLSVVSETPAQEELMGDAASTGVFEKAFEQQQFDVTPADIADAVLYFAGTTDSPPVTGQTLSVNGGVSFPR